MSNFMIIGKNSSLLTANDKIAKEYNRVLSKKLISNDWQGFNAIVASVGTGEGSRVGMQGAVFWGKQKYTNALEIGI